MKTILKQLSAAICISYSLIFSVQGAVTDQDIFLYNQAAAGDEDKVEQAYQVFNQLIEQDGPTPLTMVYLGSSQTLQGRDAWMPWNALRYVEKGLANIDKGLTLLASDNTPLNQQIIRTGLQESYLTRALAATTYSQLPDMFNHFERGYEAFLTLLKEPEFKQQPFAASAWIYHYAIQAALRAEDLPQAVKWLTEMQEKDKTHPQTIDAQALVTQEAS